MLKTISLSLVFLACGGTGAFLSRAMNARVRELELCLQMLASMRAMLQFSRPPLIQMLGDLCAQSGCPGFLPVCFTRMREGIAFPAAWREALASGGPLKEDDRQPLRHLSELLGASDASGQREALLLQEALLRTQLDAARARRDARGKACVTLGILAGLTMMILFM